jgi:hypothetical protein
MPEAMMAGPSCHNVRAGNENEEAVLILLGLITYEYKVGSHGLALFIK